MTNRLWAIITGIALAIFLFLLWQYISLQRQKAVADCLNHTIDIVDNKPDHIGVCNYLQTGNSEWLGTWVTPKV